MMQLPTLFSERMSQILGQEASDFFEALNNASPVSIRLNPHKQTPLPPFQNLLDTPVPWCNNAFYLKERPLFTLDPFLHGGVYYVQEASSMFLQTVLQQITGHIPWRVLDLCAAPGGKSTLLAARLPQGSLLVSNEVIKSRAVILKENMIKWGNDHTVITQSDPQQFSSFTGAFDLILVDAPCSGEGMFRKDPKAIEEWSENNLRLCEERQKRILSDIWNALAPGGYLIYSTCTYNPGENEKILEWLLTHYDATSIEIRHPFEEITKAKSSAHGYRFYPHHTRGEGFFIGVMQKNNGERFQIKKEKRNNKNKEIGLPKEFNIYLRNPDLYYAYQKGDTIGIIPREHADFIQQLSSKVDLLYKGCELGEVIKGKNKPTHALALSPVLAKNNIRIQEVDLQTAIRYLKKEELRFEAPQGEWVLISYLSTPLGWVKEVGNRINNYYPKEWRIRNF